MADLIELYEKARLLNLQNLAHGKIDLDKEVLSNIDYLDYILSQELELRRQAAIKRHTNASRLPKKDFDPSRLKPGIAWQVEQLEKAFLISPIVNMEKLICDMMLWANVNESELAEKKEIKTDFGETLSWDYLCYVRENQIEWNVPTYMLYGEKDNLTSFETISKFANQMNASLTVMRNGEHWFHTDEQMEFLDNWIRQSIL